MSDNKIKSALEIALEKAARLGELTQEESTSLRWTPEGERLAGFYLKDKTDLAKQLASLQEESFPYVLKGLLGVLLPGLTLPRDEAAKSINQRIIQGLKLLCRDRQAMDALITSLGYVLDHYATNRTPELQKIYNELKEQVEAHVQQTPSQRGAPTQKAPVKVESLPEFQAQWKAVVTAFEQQYEGHLVRIREQLRELILARPAFPLGAKQKR